MKNFTSFILGKFFTACGSCAVSNSVNNDRRSKGFTWVLWTQIRQDLLSLFKRVPIFIHPNPLKLTTFKKVVNRSDLQDTLHIFMQNANFRLSIRVDDKFCGNSNIESLSKRSIRAATASRQDMKLSWTVSWMHLFSCYLSWWGHLGPTV